MSQETAGNSVYQQSASSGFRQSAESVSSEMQAERLVASVLLRLGRAESVSARIRQRTRAQDMVLVGTGRYLQQGRGVDQQFRFEVVNKADTETFELLEVSDGISFGDFRREAVLQYGWPEWTFLKFGQNSKISVSRKIKPLLLILVDCKGHLHSYGVFFNLNQPRGNRLRGFRSGEWSVDGTQVG